MKFVIRAGFVVHQTKMVDVQERGEIVQRPQSSSYYEGQTVDFDKDEALDHLHKLEPADKAAAAFCEALVLPTQPAPASGGADQAALTSAIANGVAQALVALGVVAAKPG